MAEPAKKHIPDEVFDAMLQDGNEIEERKLKYRLHPLQTRRLAAISTVFLNNRESRDIFTYFISLQQQREAESIQQAHYAAIIARRQEEERVTAKKKFSPWKFLQIANTIRVYVNFIKIAYENVVKTFEELGTFFGNIQGRRLFFDAEYRKDTMHEALRVVLDTFLNYAQVAIIGHILPIIIKVESWLITELAPRLEEAARQTGRKVAVSISKKFGKLAAKKLARGAAAKIALQGAAGASASTIAGVPIAGALEVAFFAWTVYDVVDAALSIWTIAEEEAKELRGSYQKLMSEDLPMIGDLVVEGYIRGIEMTADMKELVQYDVKESLVTKYIVKAYSVFKMYFDSVFGVLNSVSVANFAPTLQSTVHIEAALNPKVKETHSETEVKRVQKSEQIVKINSSSDVVGIEIENNESAIVLPTPQRIAFDNTLQQERTKAMQERQRAIESVFDVLSIPVSA